MSIASTSVDKVKNYELDPDVQLMLEVRDDNALAFVADGRQVHGIVDLVIEEADGSRRPTGQVGKGEVVGEMALLTDDRRSATVVAR